MRLWRLSSETHARVLDGGYGRENEGRWNRRGQLVTYLSTVPSLAVLEKLVHIEDLDLFPNNLFLVRVEAPDDIEMTVIEDDDLPAGWHRDITVSQSSGADWYDRAASPLLRVPSVVCRSPETSDRNYVVNHVHPRSRDLRVADATPFPLDLRLLSER